MLKVTCAIIIHRNKILVAQRNANSEHPLKWEFPGGKIDTNEKPDTSISREIKEELQIEIEIFEKMTSVNYDYGFKKIQLIKQIRKRIIRKKFNKKSVKQKFPKRNRSIRI